MTCENCGGSKVDYQKCYNPLHETIMEDSNDINDDRHNDCDDCHGDWCAECFECGGEE